MINIILNILIKKLKKKKYMDHIENLLWLSEISFSLFMKVFNEVIIIRNVTWVSAPII